jgi:hypothetical protein
MNDIDFGAILATIGTWSLIILGVVILIVIIRIFMGRGIIQMAKSGKIGDEAEMAWNRGDKYFTPIMNYPFFRIGFTGAITDWALMIESITDKGWVMKAWSTSIDKNGRPQAMPLFVRGEK